MAAIGTAWADGAWIQASWVTGAWSSVATVTAAITGTIVAGGALEAEIVAGGETIIITLTNDTWVASGASFNAQRQNILDGLDSAESEVAGWNAEVRDKEVVGSVVRTSDTVVTITLSAAAAYDITANETITVTVHEDALVTSSTPITASPTFFITFADDEIITASGTAWNKYWSNTYGPDFERAQLAKRKEVQKAITTLKRAPDIAPIVAVQSLAKRSLASELMSDEADKIMVMLAYYEYLRWRKRRKADDERAAEILLL